MATRDREQFLPHFITSVAREYAALQKAEKSLGITRQELHQTGLGIKLRFLLALIFIALLPTIFLVVVLGDPSGREQQTTLGQAALLAVQMQAQTFENSFSQRRAALAALAASPSLATLATPIPSEGSLSSQGPTATLLEKQAVGREMLQLQQQADPAFFAWLLVRPDGIIEASGTPHDPLAGGMLSHIHLGANPTLFVHLVQEAQATPVSFAFFEGDNHTMGVVFAMPLAERTSSHPVFLTLYSLSPLAGSAMRSPMMNGAVVLLLDRAGRIIERSGALAPGQQAAPIAPGSLQSMPLNVPTFLQGEVLTGNNVVAVGAEVQALHARYVLLIPANNTFVPSTRSLIAGRNAPLLFLSILVAVVLVGTWVALPIIRPIRRATRGINATSQEVRFLSLQAQRIAQDHRLGTTILSGTSKRLSLRRQAIIRDSDLIQKTCDVLKPRIEYLQQATKASTDLQLTEALCGLQQGLVQMYGLAGSIAGGLERDQSLGQLDTAMQSAREMSKQFEEAGQKLAWGAQQLVAATHHLV